MEDYQNEEAQQMDAARSVYEQPGDMPSEKLLKTLEWWLTGLGWGRLLIALGLFVVLIVFFSDWETLSVQVASSFSMMLFRNPIYLLLCILSWLVGVATLVLSIIDIVQVNKVTNRIIGLVLFFILLRPGYIIWREHILGWKKTLGIVNIILHILYFVIGYALVFCWVFRLMMSI